MLSSTRRLFLAPCYAEGQLASSWALLPPPPGATYEWGQPLGQRVPVLVSAQSHCRDQVASSMPPWGVTLKLWPLVRGWSFSGAPPGKGGTYQRGALAALWGCLSADRVVMVWTLLVGFPLSFLGPGPE